MAGARPAFEWEDLEPEVLDPRAVTLLRLFKHPGGEWRPPPPEFRNLRVDPPVGHKSRYAVLYTSPMLETIAQECQVLAVDSGERWTVNRTRELELRIARYSFRHACVFVRLDGRNASLLGVHDLPATGGYGAYQELGLILHDRFAHFAHGISWRSYHRHQNGRVYALWHSRKRSIGLKVTSVGELRQDAEWVALKAHIPGVIELE
jgi:RES domain